MNLFFCHTGAAAMTTTATRPSEQRKSDDRFSILSLFTAFFTGCLRRPASGAAPGSSAGPKGCCSWAHSIENAERETYFAQKVRINCFFSLSPGRRSSRPPDSSSPFGRCGCNLGVNNKNWIFFLSLCLDAAHFEMARTGRSRATSPP